MEINLDKEIRQCLMLGDIRIGVYFDILQAVLKQGKKPISVTSDRGIQHLLLSLISAVFPNIRYKQKVRKIPYALNITGRSELDHLFLKKSYTHIFLKNDRVHICYYQIGDIALNTLPGMYLKKGEGATFSEAITKIKDSEYALISP